MFNENNDKVVSNILLLLTKQEAIQFVSDLNDLINDDNVDNHHYINNYDYSKEIIIALYDENNSSNFFSERCKN